MKTSKYINDLKEIPAKELNKILRQGVLLRMPYLESRLLQAKQNVINYEQKYQIKLEKLRSEGLPEDAGYEMHEDFIEWEYWFDVMNDNRQIINQLKKLLKEAVELQIEY